MPGTTYHLILITPDRGIATYGYREPDDTTPALQDVFGRHRTFNFTVRGRAYVYIGDIRVRVTASPDISCEDTERSPFSVFLPSDDPVYGPVVLRGYSSPLDGPTTMQAVDMLLEDMGGSRMIPWPGREPDEETVP